MRMNELVESIDAELEERGPAPKKLCLSSKPDSQLGASQLASCKSQGLRARKTKRDIRLGKEKVKLNGKRIKGKKYGGLPY